MLKKRKILGNEFIKGKGGSISRSDRFFNSDGSRAPEIRLEKSTPDGKIYVSECVPDSANKRIWITSAYINKKGSKGQLLNIEDTSSPQPTPEASFDSNATDISIPQSTEKSTDSAKKVSESSRRSTEFAPELKTSAEEGKRFALSEDDLSDLYDDMRSDPF